MDKENQRNERLILIMLPVFIVYSIYIMNEKKGEMYKIKNSNTRSDRFSFS